MNSEHEQSLSVRLLEKIEGERVEPKPQWHFLLHESVVWLVIVLAFIVGTVATALTFYIVHTLFSERLNAPTLDLDALAFLVPWLWLALIAVGMFYAIHAFRATARGYRFNRHWLVLGALALSVTFGGVLSALGFSEALDRFLLSEVAMYGPASGYQPHHWMNVEAGHWAGVVRERRPDMLVVETLDGNLWQVALTETTLVRGNSFVPEEQMYVRVIGTTTEIGMCEAYEVRPFRGRGGMRGAQVQWASY